MSIKRRKNSAPGFECSLKRVPKRAYYASSGTLGNVRVITRDEYRSGTWARD